MKSVADAGLLGRHSVFPLWFGRFAHRKEEIPIRASILFTDKLHWRWIAFPIGIFLLMNVIYFALPVGKAQYVQGYAINLLIPIYTLMAQYYAFKSTSGYIKRFLGIFLFCTLLHFFAMSLTNANFIAMEFFGGVSPEFHGMLSFTVDMIVLCSKFLFAMAVVYLFQTLRRSYSNMITLLDTSILFTLCSVFAWYYVISPLLRKNELTQLEEFTLVVHPVNDLFLVLLLIFFILKKQIFATKPVRYLFAAAIGLQVTTDFLLLYAVHLTQPYTVMGPVLYHSLVFGNAFVRILYGVGAYMIARMEPCLRPIRMTQDQDTFNRSTMYARMLASFTGMALLIYSYMKHDNPVFLWAIGGVAALLLIRELASTTKLQSLFLATRELSITLEQKVQERTKELAEKNEQLERLLLQVKDMAMTDALTGLPNRYALERKLNELLQRKTERFALIFLDLDRFKQVNDSYGHAAGDALLQEVARRIYGVLPQEETMFVRIAGDEFVIIMERRADEAQVIRLLDDIYAQTVEPVLLDGHAIPLCFSTGVSLYPDSGQTADDLLSHADAAMYRAKRSGRNSFCFYSERSDVGEKV